MTDKGIAIETANEMFDAVQKAFKTGKNRYGESLKKPDKLVLLMHDVMFWESTQGNTLLDFFINLLKDEKYNMEFISNY